MYLLNKSLQLALRMLVRHPGLSATCVLTFGLSIGLTTTMFSVVNGAFRGLPVEGSGQLMHLERTHLSRSGRNTGVPIHDFTDWRQQQKSFEGLSAFYVGTANLSSTEGRPERYAAAFLSANAFELLRTQPALGRVFAPGEDRPGAAPVVILGHTIWQNRFRSDPAVVGSAVRVNGEQRTVVGVMPEGFAFPVRQDLWMPLALDPLSVERGSGIQLEVFGRLRDEVSLEQARTEFAEISRRLALAYPEANEDLTTLIKPYTEEFVGQRSVALLFTMLGAVFGVLLIACANVGNLLVAQAARRSKEMALRAALGATRRQVAFQLLVEVFVLSAVGAAVGLAIAQVGITLFDRLIAGTDQPYWLDIRIDATVLAFVIALTFVTSLLSGLVPALQVARGDVNEVLKEEHRGGSSRRLSRFSKALVVVEIAVACGLLVPTGLMIKSVAKLRTIDYGFATDDVLTARLELSDDEYPGAPEHQAFYDGLVERLEARQEVASVALTSHPPTDFAPRTRIAIEGHAYSDFEDHPRARRVIVSPSFFSVFGVEVESGRAFTPADDTEHPPVAIVNRSFAERHFRGDEAIGKRFRLARERADEEPWLHVVGVVKDLYLSGADDEEPEGFYLPLAQESVSAVAVVTRTRGEPMKLAPVVREEVAAADPHLPLYQVSSMRDFIRQSTWFYDVFGILFITFGSIALFLALLGFYAVMAFAVNQRKHEIGIRLALGARLVDVMRIIFGQASIQFLLGLVLGLFLASGIAQALPFVLFQVEPLETSVFLSIALLMGITALLACAVPVWSLLRFEPATTLRDS